MRAGLSRPARILSVLAPLAATLAATVGTAAPASAQVSLPAAAAVGQGFDDFYKARDGRPLWFAQPGGQANALLKLLSTSELDGLEPTRYPVTAIEKALREAGSGSRKAQRRADALLSRTFVNYVQDLSAATRSDTLYVDEALKPRAPSARQILQQAARAPSLERYVAQMGWMHPIYGQLRQALASGDFSPEQRDLVRVNLERARELPGGNGRYVLVNAAAQRLFMYEDGRPVDSMRVVVGKPKYPTPMMAALIRFANLNPYWYVPPDLTAERIAPNVLKQGSKYLDRQGYQVVSDFVPDPQIYDPSEIDWKAVADGQQKILIRQLPGPYNSMGRIKFMFPNEEGVYLHDNPERELFEQAARLYSGGCVRLEDAWRLSSWLFGRELSWKGAGVEEKVTLERPVPVYITYLTAVPEGPHIAFLDDVYGRDAKRVAALARPHNGPGDQRAKGSSSPHS